MKIAIATFANLPNPPVKGGAVETLIDNICRINENKKKFKIDLFSIADVDAEMKSSEYFQTKFVYYPTYKANIISTKTIVWKLFKKSIPNKTMTRIVTLINKESYDFVIVTSINSEMEYIFKKIKSKVIWYLHGDPLSVLSIDTIRKITNQCYAAITVSDFVKSRLRIASSNVKVITIRNCSDLNPIPVNEEMEVIKRIRKKLDIGISDELFVYIGRITPIKGVYELVQAFNLAAIQHSKLLIVGSPSNAEEEIYFDKIKNISNSNVRFLGYVEHSKLNEIYCAADCIVVPSICHEAAPLIVLEALACRRRLIATNTGGIPEYMTQNGSLVNCDDNFIMNLANELIAYDCKNDNEYYFDVDSSQLDRYYEDFYNALEMLNKENYKDVKIGKYNQK